MLIDFQYVFPHVVLLSLTWVPGHLLHKVCVRLILNVHTSRSCRKYASVAKCIGLWIAPVRMARRNSKVSLFYWWILPRGFKLRKTIVMGGTFMYFQGGA